jgi:hypothetical protein
MNLNNQEEKEYSIYLIMRELPTLTDQQLVEVHTEIEDILRYRSERER